MNKRIIGVAIALITSVCLIVLAIQPQPASAQITPQEVARQVYQRLPEFPLENQYIRRDTGAVDPENTLVSRLIRYHIYVKNRPVNFRLDWKLTLADYLDVNEYLVESVYPGYDNLRESPMPGDRTVINRLSRQERDMLVGTLVRAFNPNYDAIAAPAPSPSATPSATPSPTRVIPRLPQQGDAQLLKP